MYLCCVLHGVRVNYVEQCRSLPRSLFFLSAGYHSSYENLYVHGLQSIGVLVTFLFGTLACNPLFVFYTSPRRERQGVPLAENASDLLPLFAQIWLLYDTETPSFFRNI